MRQINDQSVWDEKQANAYAQNRHGPDGKRFLDPMLYAYMDRANIEGQDVLDIGCGTGPWATYALEQGAKSVTALDVNQAMLDQARLLLAKDGTLPANVSLERHDANALPAEWTGRFSRILSINVGCNLSDLRRHFAEACRVATSGATMLVTAPNSLETVFTDGEPDGIEELLARWRTLGPDEKNSATAKRMIAELQHVHRATFRLLESGNLITVSNLLPEGTPILRRIPGLAVDNNFHTDFSYIKTASEEGWVFRRTDVHRFSGEAEREAFNTASERKLGPEYVTHPPFLVMELQK